MSSLTYTLQIIQRVELGAQATVYTQKLLVHDCCQRQCTERVHAGLIHGLRVLVLALKLECEVISQVPAFVVSAQQPERIRVPDFEGPKVEDALLVLADVRDLSLPFSPLC
jgi:beta-lactam-binding protein with PASTA domain